MRVPWTARRSNQSILKEISPEYALEGLMLKLKLQYFGYLMRRTDSLEKMLMLGRWKAGRENRAQGPSSRGSLAMGVRRIPDHPQQSFPRAEVRCSGTHGVKAELADCIRRSPCKLPVHTLPQGGVPGPRVLWGCPPAGALRVA